MATAIQHNKTRNFDGVCCEQEGCYVVRGKKRILKKDAVPTIFTMEDAVTTPGLERGEPQRVLTRCRRLPVVSYKPTDESVKRMSTKEPLTEQHEEQLYKEVNNEETLSQTVLNLTLELICLLTGEDYIAVKKIFNQHLRLSPIYESSSYWINKKILELTNKMIELLTGEVPIRCQDVTVYFSMEEWEYLEGHKDLYEEVMMDDHQSLTSPGGPHEVTTLPIWESCVHEEENFRNEFQRNMIPISCNGGSLKGAADQAEPPSLHIKEERGSCEGIANLEHRTVIVKEDKGSDDEECAMDNIYSHTSTDSVQEHPQAQIKDGPLSWEGGKYTDNQYVPTDHTYYMTSYIKEEPLSCDEGDLIDDNMGTQTYPATSIKAEPMSHNGVNITHHNIDTPIDHIHKPSTHIKEELDSYDGENITDLYIYPSTHHTGPYIKKEPVSWEGESPNNTTLPSHIQQDSSVPIKEEPVSCEVTEMDYTTEDKKDVLNVYIPRNLLQECPPSNSTAETNVGHTDVKPNSSTLVRSVVMAHLLEMSRRKQASIDDIHTNSQGLVGVANTSTNKLEFMETELEQLSFKNGLGSTQRVYVKKRPPEKVEAKKTFGDISNLTKYLRANSRKKTPQCSQCGQYFLRKSHLEAHVRIHVAENQYECVECGKYFLDNDQLLDHQKSHKPEYGCPVCGKGFDKESSLLKHQKVHEEQKPFQCLECGKCFNIYYELFIHQKTHAEDKKFHCSNCGKSYNSKGHFDVHRRTHTGERPYGCTGCGRRFMEKKKLLVHQKLHTGLKPHECLECGKKFVERSNLIIHRRIHTGRKPVECFHCGKNFSTRSSLIRHIVTHAKLRQCSVLNVEKRQQIDLEEQQPVPPSSSEGSAVKLWLVKD